MAYRRRRQRSLANQSDRHIPNNMDQLTFKYMMCKVESSTDSDSEISPRWSDTSTMGCVSSAPESGTSRRPLSLTHKPAGRHGCYSLFLDPYDGSSEDSDESNTDVAVSSRQTRQQGKCGGGGGGGGGGCRHSGRSRRLVLHHPASVSLREVVKNGMRHSFIEQQHHLDVQMKCGSDFEPDALPSHADRDGCRNVTEETTRHTQIMDTESQLDDSGLHTTRPQMLDSSSEKSPSSCNLRPFYKRKLGLLGAGMVELGQRKRQCVVSMEDDHEGKDSAPEPC
ncbi:uncharacterized protein LOC125023929 isoform X2 [Mugil cephalus]|uniref:uncharacterized protein LOC125023929 isoform X2 n=1 Tax=Mugil cephalus TaxID=48193 RepID=UPI001FB7528D|nr:uncharacterized protein LOC125023929 isoform X2 [Mugil cephalus]